MGVDILQIKFNFINILFIDGPTISFRYLLNLLPDWLADMFNLVFSNFWALPYKHIQKQQQQLL
mgnify:CR=1 FL=1